MASLLQWQCHAFDRFTLSTLYEMLRLRDQVFVLEQQSIYGDLDGLDQNALHVVGRNGNGVLQAYARLLAPGDKYPNAAAITRVVVDPALRGAGVGRQLMTEALQQCQQRFPLMAQQLSAQVSSLNFYQALGFQTISAPYDDGGILHVDMRREARD